MKLEITEELKQRNKELLILNSVITSMHQYLNLGELLESSLEKVLEIMSIESGAILLLDENKAQFVLEVTKGFSSEFAEKISVINANDNTIGKTICSGNHLLIWEGDDSRLSSNDWLTGENLNTLFFLPIKTKQKVYALMMCGHRYSRFFSTRNIEVLENIGQQLALLLENSMLYKEVKESQRLYQNLIESVDVGILSFDKDGTIFQCNKKAARLFDLTEGGGVGCSFREIISEKHVHLIEEIINNYSNALGNDNGADQTILECRKSANEQEVPLEISYTIWGERLSPTITATIKDMRPY
jgi:PAS domain S-box-containing protein